MTQEAWMNHVGDEGRDRARTFHSECAYVGPAPVPLLDYVISVEAQVIGDEPIRRAELTDAFQDISIDSELLDLLGPAVRAARPSERVGSDGAQEV